MAYETRTVQTVAANSLPTGTDPMVDNTTSGDVQAIKIIDATAGSTTPLAGQKARAISLSVTLSTEDIAALVALPADAATQTTAAAILAKLIAAPATEAKQDTGNASLASLVTQTDGIEGSLTSILAKLIAAPATEAKQDTQITAEQAILAKLTADPATQTTLAAILAKIIAAPATEAKQDSQISLLTTQAGYLDGLESALASILAKIIAAPATEAKQDAEITALGTLLTLAGFQARINTFGQKTMAASTPVVLASDQSGIPLDAATLAALETINAAQSGTWTVQPGNTQNTTPWLTKEMRSATPTQSSVAGSASSVSLLASNSSRLGATIYNDSASVLYLKLGGTASATSFSVLLAGNGSGIGGYYEVPANYTGAIDGIWASATGNARITELT